MSSSATKSSTYSSPPDGDCTGLSKSGAYSVSSRNEATAATATAAAADDCCLDGGRCATASSIVVSFRVASASLCALVAVVSTAAAAAAGAWVGRVTRLRGLRVRGGGLSPFACQSASNAFNDYQHSTTQQNRVMRCSLRMVLGTHRCKCVSGKAYAFGERFLQTRQHPIRKPLALRGRRRWARGTAANRGRKDRGPYRTNPQPYSRE